MNRPAAKAFAHCIGHDFKSIGVRAWRVFRYYLPFHVRGFVRSLFQPNR